MNPSAATSGAFDPQRVLEADFELVDLPPSGSGPLQHTAGPANRWLCGTEPSVLLEAAEELAAADPDRMVVLECPPAAVAAAVGNGALVAVCPDELGAEPGGALEAVVTAAVVDGAHLVRSHHGLTVNRCLHLASALALESTDGAAK